jgi:cyanophycinase
VIMFDGFSLKNNNFNKIAEGQPLSIENMIIHVLAKGDQYDLKERKFISCGLHQELVKK